MLKNNLHSSGLTCVNLLPGIADGGWWKSWTLTRTSRCFDWGVNWDRTEMIKLRWICQGKNSRCFFLNSPQELSPKSIKNCQNRILLKMQKVFSKRGWHLHTICAEDWWYAENVLLVDWVYMTSNARIFFKGFKISDWKIFLDAFL